MLTDVKSTKILNDRCLCHMFTSLDVLADVIAKDVMAILPCDRCYGHHY